MSEPPLISVIVPVCNDGEYLAISLASIRRQQWPRLELLLVDSTTDGTAAAVRAAAPEARYVWQAGRGPGAARNAGLGLAQGEWVAFLDADDEWPEGTLATLAAALVARPDALFAIGLTRFEPPTVKPWVSPNLGAGLYRREAFTRIGMLAENPRQPEDVDWFLRARELGICYATVEQETLCYRRRAGSQTADRSWREFELEAVIRASLARRRQAAGAAQELPLLSRPPSAPGAAGPRPSR